MLSGHRCDRNGAAGRNRRRTGQHTKRYTDRHHRTTNKSNEKTHQRTHESDERFEKSIRPFLCGRVRSPVRRVVVVLSRPVADDFSSLLSSPPLSSLSLLQHELDGPVEDIQWADLQNVFILTRLGTLYHSDNGGHTFTNQMANMSDATHNSTGTHARAGGDTHGHELTLNLTATPDACIDDGPSSFSLFSFFFFFSPDGIHHVGSMYISEKDPHKVLFTGKDKSNFHTLDMGVTYTACPEIEIQDVRLHPIQHDWILASSMSSGCHATEEGPSGEDCFKIVRK